MILKYLIKGTTEEEKERMKITKMFALTMDEAIFEGLDFYLYKFVKDALVLNCLLDENLLDNFMEYSLKSYMLKHNVKTQATTAFNFKQPSGIKSAFLALKQELANYYNDLSKGETDISLYKSDLYKFKNEFLNKKMYEVITSTAIILRDNKDNKSGVNDAIQNSMKETSMIESMTKMFDEILEDRVVDLKPYPITRLGIDYMDEHFGDLKTGYLLEITAPPSWGKTIYTVMNPCYNAIVLHNANVLYLSIEQSESILNAIMLTKRIHDTTGKFISFKDIESEVYENSEVESLVNITKYNLFEKEEQRTIGRFIVGNSENLYSNTIKQVVEQHEAKYGINFDVVVIDYMADLSHKQIGKEFVDKADLTKEGYKEFHDLCRTKNKLGIALNQLTKEGIDNVMSGKPVTFGNTAGGQASDRYVELSINIGGTQAEYAKQIRDMQIVKCRFAPILPRVKCGINMMVGLFREIKSSI